MPDLDMQDLVIRPARSRDSGAIADVLKRCYMRQLAPDYPAALLQMALPVITRPRPEQLTSPGFMVAVRHGQVVACGGWSRAASQGGEGPGDVGHIRHLACDPDHLRQGIAAALMRTALDQARAAGMRLLACLSTRRAVPFYRALGFEGDAEVELRLKPGLYFPAVEMRLALG